MLDRCAYSCAYLQKRRCYAVEVCWLSCAVLSRANTKAVEGLMDVANNVSFVPLCAVSLSLLEGGANGIDDTATQFAEVRAHLRRFHLGRVGWVKGQKED